jgi:drug/metabolite transporter (DMT)-like permease
MAYPREVGAKQASKLDLALLLTLTTIALWALNIPVVKIGLEGWSPMAFSFIRFGAGAIIYIAYVLWREGSLRVRRKDIPLFVIGGAIGIALNQYAFMYALEKTTASTVTLVFATTPLWAALLARVPSCRSTARRASCWRSARLSRGACTACLSARSCATTAPCTCRR